MFLPILKFTVIWGCVAGLQNISSWDPLPLGRMSWGGSKYGTLPIGKMHWEVPTLVVEAELLPSTLVTLRAVSVGVPCCQVVGQFP